MTILFPFVFTMNSVRKRRPLVRNGATIIEVMFAVGVLLFGLVGMAALIPAAGKMARSSIDLDRGASIGQSISAEFEARGYGMVSGWRMIGDTAAQPTVIPGSITTLGPVAIDPLFVSRPENFVAPGTSVGLGDGQYESINAGSHNYFRRNRFPYYAENYNPLVDPRFNIGSNDWPSMPRLDRVAMASVGSDRGITGASPISSRFLASKAASKLADDTDQLVFDSPSDESLPVTQVLRIGANAATANDFPIPSERTGRPEYSWFATVMPKGSNYATLSVVVVRGRDRTFETPVSGTLASSDPLEVSERLAYVSSAVGFLGGAGGTVNLVGSSAVSSELATDGWIMLLRNTPLGPVHVGPVHAWYRIVHADREATFGTFPDPNGGPDKDVWQRGVTLEGPDWDFEFSPGALGFHTLAVLVDGVISVTESPIRLRP